MNRGKRLLSGLLSLVMLLSLCTALPAKAHAADEDDVQTGSIGLTVCFDRPQTKENVDRRDLTLTLEDTSGKNIVVPLSQGEAAANGFDGAFAVVRAKNEHGGELTTERRIGSYEAVVYGLPRGTYMMTVTGKGYVPLQETTLDLAGYSRHVIIGTGNGSFALGDVNGDNKIDNKDLKAMDGYLGKAKPEPLYDLNGDGVVDVTDLAYIKYSIDFFSEADIKETAAIVSPKAVATENLYLAGGTAADLFTPGTAVTLRSKSGEALEIPIEFGEDPVDMERIAITCPDGAGAIQAGSVEATVVAENGDEKTKSFPFDIAAPAGVRAIGSSAEESVVTVDLGSRVAVKKVTIKVEEVAGQAGYATVTQIEFLKDIVPDAPRTDTQVSQVKAVAGDGQVALSWNPVRNITGYTVNYGASENDLHSTVEVNETRATVSGLDNLKTYYFQVTATNDGWTGIPSAVVSAAPQPAAPPGAPSNIQVESRDEALQVSWGKTKDASYYQVFFRVSGTKGSFQRTGGDLDGTSTVITGLVNGTAYEVAVKAGNARGTGLFSAAAVGTPAREDIELPDLPAYNRIPASGIESVAMADPSNVDSSLCPKFEAAHVIDGDASTYWIARNWWHSSEFTYTFTEPQDMNYMILVPYLNGKYRNTLKNYTVTAEDSGGNVLLTGTYRAPGMTSANYLVLPFPQVKGVKSLTVGLAEWEGNGVRVSVSEMAFYKSDKVADDISGLFADKLFTTLRKDVTREEIAGLRSRLSEISGYYLDLELLSGELDLAQSLLEEDNSALGLVRTGFQSRSASAEADRTAGQTASDFQPLGVSVVVSDMDAASRTGVAVYAELPSDASDYPVCIVPTQFYGESGIWKGSAIQLAPGRNYISIPKIGSLKDERGGQLYLTYAGQHPEQIKLHVRGNSAKVIPIPTLELSSWYTMDNAQRRGAIADYVAQLTAHVGKYAGNPQTNVRNATDISTPSVLLSLPADQVLAGLQGVGNDQDAMVDVMYQNVLAWEEELFIANKVQGIIASDASPDTYKYPMTTRQNIRYMRMFAGAFMYAAGNHIGIGYGSAAALVQGRPVSGAVQGTANGLFGWGIAHEIGHNMDKLGKAEITNNIYSLAVQAWDGKAMELETRLTAGNTWRDIYDKVSVGRPGAAGNVFVQLGMYWQLHLAYDEADKPLAFYNEFFKRWKRGDESGLSYEDRVAVLASGIVQKDLSEFFTRWGLVLSDDAKSRLENFSAKETRAIWYLNDDARSYRLKKDAAPYQGTTAVTAATQDNTVTLTISSTGNSQAILGYEIRRNGTPVGFTTGKTYTDDLGAANNRTYTYSVVPIDLLGNIGGEVKANEVRVAWDATIDAKLYNIKREGKALVITMSKPVPVTGIKVLGDSPSPATGVTIAISGKTEAGSAWTITQSGTPDGSGNIYFRKPGTEESDTRLWTYDAESIRITGLPEKASVALLDYPGDRVDFYEAEEFSGKAAVGRLSEAYTYETPNGSVTVPKGTVVILGTYRGDPVYNVVMIEGRYTAIDDGDDDGSGIISRTIPGEALFFAEIPKDGEVSDISDGIFLFVTELAYKEKGAADNIPDGVKGTYPFEIRAILYRTDDPYEFGQNRTTSETLWISFPDMENLPWVSLASES